MFYTYNSSPLLIIVSNYQTCPVPFWGSAFLGSQFLEAKWWLGGVVFGVISGVFLTFRPVLSSIQYVILFVRFAVMLMSEILMA